MHARTRALAAAATGLVLLGGAGTAARWTDTAPLTGGSITSGALRLDDPACGGWMLDAAGGATAFDPSTDRIAPGDVLTRTCTYVVRAVGDHLVAELSAGVSAFAAANELSEDLIAVQPVFEVDGAPVTRLTPAHDGSLLEAALTVAFDPASGNESQDVTAVLDDVTVTATQVHP